MGFHYDLEDYEEALLVFRRMQEAARESALTRPAGGIRYPSAWSV